MVNVKNVALALAAVFVYTTCIKDAPANNANGSQSDEKTVPVGTSKDALVSLEKSTCAAWKSKDAKFWDTFLSDKFVGWGTLWLKNSGATESITYVRGVPVPSGEIESQHNCAPSRWSVSSLFSRANRKALSGPADIAMKVVEHRFGEATTVWSKRGSGIYANPFACWLAQQIDC
jgi:hypothetical protein